MATADELLATTSETMEEKLVADLANRTIVIPTTLRILGVESDDDVRRLYFSVPRYYGEIDLSEFKIQVNFENAKGDGDVWPVDDLIVNQDGTLTFSWLVDRSAFKYAGNVIFNLCMKKYDTEGIVVKELNTTTASLPVLKGLETSKELVENNPSAFDAILFRLYAVEEDIKKINENGSIPDSGGNADQSGGNGLSSTEKTLMLSLFKNTIFATDMDTTIAQLEAYWNGSGGNEGGDTGGDEPGGDIPPVVETLPSWIAEMQVVEFTPEADTNEVQTFAISMENEPNMVFITSDIEAKIDMRDFVSAVYMKSIAGGIGRVAGYTNTNGFVLAHDFPTGSISASEVTITTPIMGGVNCYWRAGHTYKVYCVKTVCDSSDMTSVPSFAKEACALTFTPEAKTNEAQTFTYEMENEPNAVLILTDYTESGSARDFYGSFSKRLSGGTGWTQIHIAFDGSAPSISAISNGNGVTSCVDGVMVFQTDKYGTINEYWLPDRTYYIIFMYM